jgi:hypothetical protein
MCNSWRNAQAGRSAWAFVLKKGALSGDELTTVVGPPAWSSEPVASTKGRNSFELRPLVYRTAKLLWFGLTRQQETDFKSR